MRRQITELVKASGTSLHAGYGIGPLIAARFLAEIVDVRRTPTATPSLGLGAQGTHDTAS